jgi:hypothetical protein
MRPQVADGGAHRVALLAKNVPQGGRKCYKFRSWQRTLRKHFGQFFRGFSGLRNAREVALDVGHKHRNAQARKAFRQGLQGDGLAGAGGAGDQAVAVGFVGPQKTLHGCGALLALANENACFVRCCHETLKKYNQPNSVTNF